MCSRINRVLGAERCTPGGRNRSLFARRRRL
jgi:hypothetical protein